MGYNLLHLRHRNKYQLDKEYQQGIEFMKISQMVEVKKLLTFKDNMYQQHIKLSW